MISIILAMAKNAVIGKNNEIPWYIPNDFQYFKNVTMGHPIIMGRKTWESLGRPLPGRKNIVITRSVDKLLTEIEAADYKNKDVVVVDNLESAFAIFGDACDSPSHEIFVIGGAEIYRQAMPFAHKLYLTAINHEFDGDTKFMHLNLPQWSFEKAIKGERNADNDYEYSFLQYKRTDVENDLICNLSNISEVLCCPENQITVPDGLLVRQIQYEEREKWEALCSVAFDYKCDFYQILESRLGFDKANVLGVFDGDKLIATASALNDYTNSNNAAFLHMICCDKEYRGRGIGKLIVLEILKKVQANGFTQAWLKTQIYRKDAIKLYERLGFSISNYS